MQVTSIKQILKAIASKLKKFCTSWAFVILCFIASMTICFHETTGVNILPWLVGMSMGAYGIIVFPLAVLLFIKNKWSSK